MVNSAREDSFVPEPRHDILVEGIGTKEHGGRVYVVGDRIDLRVTFGTSKKRNRQVQKETLEELHRKIYTHKQEFDKKLEAERETCKKEFEDLKYLYAVCESENCIIRNVWYILC